MIPKPHPRQPERLAALAELDIMDTGRDPAFDDLTLLASTICGTPIAIVNLIGKDRAWFKSEIGLGITETPVNASICAHAILEPDFVEIADTRDDPRTRDNPLVLKQNGLRFYAGAHLTSPDGLPIGSLCVLDYQPRHLTDDQRDALRILARQAMAQIELRHTAAKAALLRHEVDHRVKNSLQIIASLTAMQARDARSDEAKEALALVRQRIQSVVDLHGRLHSSDSDGMIDLQPYLTGIVATIKSFSPNHISLQSDVVPVSLPARQAMSLALLINEFYTNSVKHAFPDQTSGKIELCVARTSPAELTLTYRDDGVGMPEDAISGLGTRVTDALVGQLGGTLTQGSDVGWGHSLAVRFPNVAE